MKFKSHVYATYVWDFWGMHWFWWVMWIVHLIWIFATPGGIPAIGLKLVVCRKKNIKGE